MKRIHLFEFEDQVWFPDWIRVLMTRYFMTFHKMLGTADLLFHLVEKGLHNSQAKMILDLCSGSGGPMIEVPLLPLFIAWDGAVSNARTYNLDDVEILIQGLSDKSHQWEKGKIKGKGGNKFYLLGMPI